MYGQPLMPNRCEFWLFIDDNSDSSDMYISGEGDICLCISDLDEPDNDDIRDVVHPDFDKFWDNACENIFLSHGFKHFKSMDDARKWCLSIGMVQSNMPLEVGG